MSALAWTQYRELTRLRAANLELTAMEVRLTAAERRNRELEAKMLALRARAPAEAASADVTGSPDAKLLADRAAQLATVIADDSGNGNEGKRDAAFELLGALADTPEFQKLLALQARGAIEGKYAALLQKLNLPPEQKAQLERLLADKQNAFVDALVAARDQGLSGKDARVMANAVAKATQKDIDASIKSLLGDQGYSQLRNYERTQPQRETVAQLAQRLSGTATPMSAQQQEQLVEVMAASTRQENSAAKAAAGAGQKPANLVKTVPALPGALSNLGTSFAGSAVISSSAVKNANTFLSDPQITALKQLQQEQQAQLTLSRLLKNNPKKPATPSKG